MAGTNPLQQATAVLLSMKMNMRTARDPEGVRRTDSRQRLGAGMNEDRASEHLDLLDDGVCQMRDQHGQIHDLLLVPCRYRLWRGARSLPPSGRPRRTICARADLPDV